MNRDYHTCRVVDALSADHLYICHNYLEVCKLNDCTESLLVLSKISDSSARVNLVVNPIKRFGVATYFLICFAVYFYWSV